jgi:hypothetical protein
VSTLVINLTLYFFSFVIERQLLANSFGGGNTRRAITKKSKRGDNGADEYVAYARFLEESVGGYSTLVRLFFSIFSFVEVFLLH